MNIGDKIKLVRRHRGLTQQQLGILIDIKKRGSEPHCTVRNRVPHT